MKFIVFEGINGCGKQLAVKITAQLLQENGLKGLDIVEYTKKENNLPDPDEVIGFDYFLTAEPTHAWIGKAIRSEMFFKNSRDYDETTMMNAYALDRHILYKRLLVPLKNAGKIILQERTISSTFAIQTDGDNAASWESVLNHSDHQYILQNLPDYIVVINIDPKFAQENDNDKYENIKKQTKMMEVYNSDKFRKEFESRGVKVLYIENDSDIPALEVKVRDLMSSILLHETN